MSHVYLAQLPIYIVRFSICPCAYLTYCISLIDSNFLSVYLPVCLYNSSVCIYLSMSLYFRTSLSTKQLIYLPIYLSSGLSHLSTKLFMNLPVCLSNLPTLCHSVVFICPPIWVFCLSNLSINTSIILRYLIYVSIYLSIHRSIYLQYLFVCLSVCRFACLLVSYTCLLNSSV